MSHLLDGFAGSGADTLRPQVLQSLHHQIHKVRDIKNEPNAVTTKWNIITQNNLIQKKLPQGKEQWTENGEIYILIPILTVA